MFGIIKKNYRYTIPGFAWITGWAMWGYEHYYTATEPTMIATVGGCVGLVFTGVLGGIVWADASRKGSKFRRWWRFFGSPLRLSCGEMTSENQTECQAGQTQHYFYAQIGNHGNRSEKDAVIKVSLKTCGQQDKREFSYKIDRIVAGEYIKIPCVEVMTNDNGSLGQYRVLSDMNGQSSEWCAFEKDLDIDVCLAADVQRFDCDQNWRFSSYHSNPNDRLSLKKSNYWDRFF